MRNPGVRGRIQRNTRGPGKLSSKEYLETQGHHNRLPESERLQLIQDVFEYLRIGRGRHAVCPQKTKARTTLRILSVIAGNIFMRRSTYRILSVIAGNIVR